MVTEGKPAMGIIDIGVGTYGSETGGIWKLIYGVKTTSDAQSIDITGLSTTKPLMMRIVNVNNAGVNSIAKIYFNNDTTDGNYDSTLLYASKGGHGNSGYDYPYLATTYNGLESSIWAFINLAGGKIHYRTTSNNKAAADNPEVIDVSGVKSNATVTSITQITLTGASANTFKAGCLIDIYELIEVTE